MDFLIFISVLSIIYLILFFFNTFFKSCMHYPYEAFLHGTGLTIKFFRIQWYTCAFNRIVMRWTNSHKRFYIRLFDIGVYLTIVLMPLGFICHLINLLKSKSITQPVQGNIIEFEILLPGINIPLDEFYYYITALAVCSIVHELGHGMAAVLQDVPLSGFGFHLVFFVPIAYTSISLEHLNVLRIWTKLRILCAGIWFNLILAIFGGLLFILLSFLFIPFYNVNTSVIVTNVKRVSPLIGENGLMKNDVITTINNCHVYNIDSWYYCLLQTIKYKPAYCIDTNFYLDNDEYKSLEDGDAADLKNVHRTPECCEVKLLKNLCFERLIAGDVGGDGGLINVHPKFVCLNVRKTIENSFGYCNNNNNNNNQLNVQERDQQKLITFNMDCDNNYCVKPVLNNVTTIIHMKRLFKSDIIYIGHPADVSETIKISEYVPKTNFIGSGFADGITLMLKYIIVFSIGLAVVNIIPCFSLDGQYIIYSIVDHLLQNIITERKIRDFIALVITTIVDLSLTRK